jgi:DNA helicase-2/ATP-dependent DNA helicase PcrA
MYQRQENSDLVSEMTYVYQHLREMKRIGEIPKLSYILDYLNVDLLQGEASLSEQLSAHMQEINTLKEADLCGSKSMHERVFVSTVHKAKGLEFDDVIVFDAVKGKFPSYYADETAVRGEEARKFYVAISRAKKRLVVTYSRQYVSPWGRVMSRELSPYLTPIRSFFEK